MGSLTEKRVHQPTRTPHTLAIAGDPGVVVVRVVDDRVGAYELAHPCTPTDLTNTRTDLVVATTDDVYRGPPDNLAPTGFGPAAAVTIHDNQVTAAAPHGRIAIHRETEWTDLADLETTITGLAGDLAATADGVYQYTPTPRHVGLSAAAAVTTSPRPTAATPAGLFELGNGWIKTLDGDFHTVTSPGTPDGPGHAATPTRAFERTDHWRPLTLPTPDPIADAAYTPAPYLITRTGTLLARSGTGTGADWRTHPLGTTGVTAMTTSPGPTDQNP